MSDASFLDNAVLVESAAEDLFGNINPLDPRFMTGTAPTTAMMAEVQNATAQGRDYDPDRARTSAGNLTPEEKARADAAHIDTGVSLIGDAAVKTAQQAGDKLKHWWDFALNPWVLGSVAALVVAAIAAPYVTPFLKGR